MLLFFVRIYEGNLAVQKGAYVAPNRKRVIDMKFTAGSSGRF